MTVDNNEFTRIDRVAVVPLEDVSKLLMPLPVVSNRVNNHDLGVVCHAVAGALLCSVWDLVVYQVPPIALDWDIFKSVYAIFRSSSPGEHLFMGYYGVEELTEEEGAGIDTPDEVAITINQFLSDCYILKPNAQTLQAELFKVFDDWSTFTSSNVLITNRMLFENLARRGIVDGNGFFIGLESTGFLLDNPKEEDGAGIDTSGGEPDEGFKNFLAGIKDEEIRWFALARWHWDNDHKGFSRWVRYKYKLDMDNPKYDDCLTLPQHGGDIELLIKLMREYIHTMNNIEDPYHLTY